jgi:signal transduction histidine kinase
MFSSARWQFAASAVLTVVGTAAVAVYGWRALDATSADAERMEAHLAAMGAIEALEAELHEVAAESPLGNLDSLERRLDAVAGLPLFAGYRPLLEQLEAEMARARMDATPKAWARVGEFVSELEKLAVDRAIVDQKDSARPIRKAADRMIRLGAVVIAVFGVLSTLAFVRLRRERRESREHLRRSDRLAALGTMAASVAHEINNPLATIAGCADAVRDRMRKRADADEDSLEYVDMIRDETRRCRDIVRGLRDLARDTPPAMAPADLSRIVREVVQLVGMQRGGPDVAIDVSGEDACEIVCDPDKVKQLLLNLLVNARDACREGGHVRVAVARSGEDRAQVTVEDDGRGIPHAELQRIFEPFHTSKTRGLGLGLFLCERIASLHGGAIRAESAGPGRGARFVVTLPVGTG